MFTRQKRFGIVLLAFLASFSFLSPASAQQDQPSDPAAATRPRLSFIDGDVSFWRPGAEDWSPARINTPLAPGDQLYTGTAANVEVQVGPQDFVRAGAESQLGLETQERDLLELKITGGHVALDLRSLPASQTVEVDTPNATFSTRQAGYYRIDVGEDSTTFVSRRGGRATITPEGGVEASIVSNDELVVEGTAQPRIERYATAEPDPWDQWNTDRTDQLAAPVSERYVSKGVYGLDTLDRNGTWRVVPSYGWVWSPYGVSAGWAPYSAGRWIWDPYYGWTWLDDAPWGWAPYHYGRWVYTGGYWGWAPGPVVVQPFYSPALVAFYGGVGFGFGFGVGAPVGWVSLSWGEPIVPWWGPVGFFGRPCWWGWGGPRVVNNVVINNNTVINTNNIQNYRNRSVGNGLVVVRRNNFGHGSVQPVSLTSGEAGRLRPVHGSLPVNPDARSVVPGVGTAQRPPRSLVERPVVASHPTHDTSVATQPAGSSLRTTRPPVSSAATTASSQPRAVPPAAGTTGVATTSRGLPPMDRSQTARTSSPPVSSSPQGVGQPGSSPSSVGQVNAPRQAPPVSSPGGTSVRQSPPPVPLGRSGTPQWPGTVTTTRNAGATGSNVANAPRSAPPTGGNSSATAPPPPRSSRVAPSGTGTQTRVPATRSDWPPRFNGPHTAPRQGPTSGGRQMPQSAPRPPTTGQMHSQPRVGMPSTVSRGPTMAGPANVNRGVTAAPRGVGGVPMHGPSVGGARTSMGATGGARTSMGAVGGARGGGR